ncbi:hypothetical protein VP249E411_P0270 [Vibrio phage 249E41-1]|nr:hypothetical protein VP249E411_P0270 [Vibrio phage 249E41-1]CAH9017582.1 hypothetical protein VP193E371_P0269 [Vibrio phage 193E37-1]
MAQTQNQSLYVDSTLNIRKCTYAVLLHKIRPEPLTLPTRRFTCF